MKGFPNQVADLEKLATGMRTLIERIDAAENPKDDGLFGEALVRAGVAGTGHTPIPVEEYIQQQLLNTPNHQSFRTTARGLRELYRLLGFIDDSGRDVIVTDAGRDAATFADGPLNGEQIDFWRAAIRNVVHDGGDGEASHPYQVLLRLVGQKPGITRAKCALALEARNDSPEELARIVALADLTEDEILGQVRVSRTNGPVSPQTWQNAIKVLPAFAEQLGDVAVTQRGRDRTYRLADVPGLLEVDDAAAVPGVPGEEARGARRADRESRIVTPETIGLAGTTEADDAEFAVPPELDPAAAAAAVRQRLDRLRRHNLIVRALAARFAPAGGQIREAPFDMLFLIGPSCLLVEMKTLDGTIADERDRVRDACAQLLYYRHFDAAPVAGDATIYSIACFEAAISNEHRAWLNAHGIGAMWTIGGGRFAADQLAAEALRPYLEELQ